MDIGLRIKELREEKNLSQDELGRLIGVTKQMISHYEGNINTPRQGKIKKMAEVFGIEESEFYKSTSNLTKSPETGDINKVKLESLQKEIDAKDREIELLKKVIGILEKGKK